jgi:aryl-alcohol dehydrogenase-like predicted oxidoreductase
MQTRQLGGTDMRVGVLGFGGAEIGFEKAEPEAVARLLGEALDAGLNVVDTAECYLGSEELIGRAVAGRRQDFYSEGEAFVPTVHAATDCPATASLRG